MKIETFLNELKKCNSLRTRIYLILAGDKRTFTVQFEKNNKGEITSVLLLPYKKIPPTFLSGAKTAGWAE